VVAVLKTRWGKGPDDLLPSLNCSNYQEYYAHCVNWLGDASNFRLPKRTDQSISTNALVTRKIYFVEMNGAVGIHRADENVPHFFGHNVASRSR
jgi:hypothetical protein